MSQTSRESAYAPVAKVTGGDIVLDKGCSKEWATWVLNVYKQINSGEVTQIDVRLMEDDWGEVSTFRENIDEQLSGGDPVELLPDAPYRYRLGFGTDHAREIADELDTALEFGASGHQFELRLAYSTLNHLATQLVRQVKEDS